MTSTRVSFAAADVGHRIHVSFSTAGLHLGSWINRLCESRKVPCDDSCGESESFTAGVIWRCFACVKCGSIMSGFRKFCDCRESRLLCDLPRMLTDRGKSQVCGWARVTRKLCPKHKNASWVFSVGDFVLKSLFCAQRLRISNLVFSA